MLISVTPSLGNKVNCRYPGFTFQTFVLQYESIILSHFLKGFPFQLSKNASHTTSSIYIISGQKPSRTILNLFKFFLKHISIRVRLFEFYVELKQSDLATTTVQSMWDRFATGLEQGIDKFIPVRKAGTRDGFPWINQE